MSGRAEKVALAGTAGAGMQGAGTRARLLHAAAEVIQEGGWGSASVGAIAKRAGVAAGTLYRHFPSKADLFLEVFRTVSERELGAMRTSQAALKGIGERFDAVVGTYARRALRNRRLAWALVYEPLDASVDVERLAYRRTYCEGMAALIREGIKAGTIPSQDAGTGRRRRRGRDCRDARRSALAGHHRQRVRGDDRAGDRDVLPPGHRPARSGLTHVLFFATTRIELPAHG